MCCVSTPLISAIARGMALTCLSCQTVVTYITVVFACLWSNCLEILRVHFELFQDTFSVCLGLPCVFLPLVCLPCDFDGSLWFSQDHLSACPLSACLGLSCVCLPCDFDNSVWFSQVLNLDALACPISAFVCLPWPAFCLPTFCL